MIRQVKHLAGAALHADYTDHEAIGSTLCLLSFQCRDEFSGNQETLVADGTCYGLEPSHQSDPHATGFDDQHLLGVCTSRSTGLCT